MLEQATIDISEARRQLNSIDEHLSTEPIIYVTRHGKKAFAFVDVECIAAMIETIEIMADPDSYEVFQKSLRDIREGRLHDHDDVMKELG
jgi:PHD/YefM family antitoxin component YafN of YafNO toxin-antitoxin module